MAQGGGAPTVPTTATTITALDVPDIRFPTFRSLDGSDAMNADPDSSAACDVLRTDEPGGPARQRVS